MILMITKFAIILLDVGLQSEYTTFFEEKFWNILNIFKFFTTCGSVIFSEEILNRTLLFSCSGNNNRFNTFYKDVSIYFGAFNCSVASNQEY